MFFFSLNKVNIIVFFLLNHFVICENCFSFKLRLLNVRFVSNFFLIIFADWNVNYGHEPPSAEPVFTYSEMKFITIITSFCFVFLQNSQEILLDLFKQFSDFITHSLGNNFVLPSSFVAQIWLLHSDVQFVLHPFVSCCASPK